MHLLTLVGLLVHTYGGWKVGVIGNQGWETDSEELIPLDTSRGGETKSELIISPILWLYVDVLLIDCASKDHSIINTQPQTMGLDCLSQHSPSSQDWFELLGMVNWIVIQVHPNLCVVENSVGKTNSHARKATELLDQLNFHLSPVSCKFWPW